MGFEASFKLDKGITLGLDTHFGGAGETEAIGMIQGLPHSRKVQWRSS